MNNDLAIGLGIGLLAGTVIGGVVALLYAPESGKETRDLIKHKSSEVLNTVRETTGDVIDTVKDAASQAGRRDRRRSMLSTAGDPLVEQS